MRPNDYAEGRLRLEDLLPGGFEQGVPVGGEFPEILGGAGGTNPSKIPHRMRLIGVARLGGEPRPLEVVGVTELLESPDESLDLRVRLCRDADVASEGDGEMFSADVEILVEAGDL